MFIIFDRSVCIVILMKSFYFFLEGKWIIEIIDDDIDVVCFDLVLSKKMFRFDLINKYLNYFFLINFVLDLKNYKKKFR